MFEKFIEAFRDRLASSDKIIITTHKNPDGDAMGSSLALMHYLRGLGKDAKVIVPNRYPDFLHWMPGQEEVLDFLADPKLARGLILEADLVCALDFNHPSRAGEVEHALRKTEAPIAMIDHHLHPDDFAQMAWSDPSKCATAEMIFLLLEALEGNTTFTAHVSSCLYAGIITDSGGFRFSNTTPLTLRIGAALMENGAVPYKIYEAIFDTHSEHRMRLMGYALHDKLRVLPAYRTAYISLTAEELETYHFKPGDTEGFVNLALSIQNVVFAVFMAEKDGLIKMSFRSSGTFPANEVASSHFQGGGHLNAAGGISQDTMQETIDRFVGLLPTYENELKKA